MSGEISINVDISSCDEFFSEIADPARVKKITRKALRKGAMVIRDAVAAEAPERPDLPSGTALPIGALMNDIIVRSYTENGKEVASVQPGALTDHVAGFVEYGHQMVTGGRLNKQGKGSGKRTKVKKTGETFVPPNAFFRRGEERSEAAAVEAIEESLGEDIANESATGADTEAEVA